MKQTVALNITLNKEIAKKAQAEANEMGLTLSAYLSILIATTKKHKQKGEQ